MADIKGILKKVSGVFQQKGEPRKGITSEETELNFFKERERLDNIKKELKIFRDKENRKVLLGDNQLFQSDYGFDKDKNNMFKSKNRLNGSNKKLPSIIGGKNTFFRQGLIMMVKKKKYKTGNIKNGKILDAKLDFTIPGWKAGDPKLKISGKKK